MFATFINNPRRCHAVLCRKVTDPPTIALKLHDSLHAALAEYKREKISRQNTRLSGMMSGYPTLPRRKQLLIRGTQNFRPPMSRSKSAPKLGSIEEGTEEEDEETETAESLRDRDDLADSESIRDLEPGTPRELEFGEAFPGDKSLLTIDIEIGNDIEKLRLEERVFNSRFGGGMDQVSRPNSTETEPDSIRVYS